MQFLNDQLFKNSKKTLLFLLLPAMVLFFKTLSYGFTSLDEQWMILKNVSFLERWSSIGDAFTKPLAEIYYRPLLMSSFIVDYHIGKLSPFIYHLTNLLLHLFSVYLLFQFLLLYKVDNKTAFVLALLFSIHPMVLHAVAWIPGRNDVILCVFSLLSFICLKKYFTNSQLKDAALYLLFFTCALLTKENALALVLVYFFIAWMEFKKDKKTAILFSICWLGLAVLFIVAHKSVIDSGKTLVFSGAAIKDFFMGFAMVFGKTIFPVSLSILPRISLPLVIVGILSLTGLVMLFVKKALKDKQLAVLGLLMFVSLLILPL